MIFELSIISLLERFNLGEGRVQRFFSYEAVSL